MYVTRRARRLAPPSFRILLGVATMMGAGAFCLAITVAYGWGIAETSEHTGQNAVLFTALVILLIGFVFWLWRQLLTALQEMHHNRDIF